MARKEIKYKNFFNKAISIYEKKYDYSLVEYVDVFHKINIICPIHGIFSILPPSHLKGFGCPKCNSKIKFIEKSKKIHENKYSYDLVNYFSSKKNINIKCPTHGIFTQTPDKHLSGQGCPKCSGQQKNTNDFILQSKSIHRDKYDYSKVIYIGSKKNVIIICTKHGEFNQMPTTHLNGSGCPKCGYESNGEQIINDYLEDNNIEHIREKKFNDCKNIRKLPFDFYLPKKNILIEYDGEQHFKPVKNWGGEIGFNKIIINDNIKNNFADNNNIKLIRIKYSEINEISNILNEIL